MMERKEVVWNCPLEAIVYALEKHSTIEEIAAFMRPMK